MHHGQLYRYAKGWYQESDNKMKDIKKVLEDGYYDLSDNGVLSILSSLAFKHIQGSGNPENSFMTMIDRLDPKSFTNRLYENEKEAFQDRLIGACLTVIRRTHKDEIGYDLPEPDAKILPLTNHNKE